MGLPEGENVKEISRRGPYVSFHLSNYLAPHTYVPMCVHVHICAHTQAYTCVPGDKDVKACFFPGYKTFLGNMK